MNNTINNNRNKIDGVAAVVGDFLVLDSDIEKQFNQLKASGISTDVRSTPVMHPRLAAAAARVSNVLSSVPVCAIC